jgi:hypothetical protein
LNSTVAFVLRGAYDEIDLFMAQSISTRVLPNLRQMTCPTVSQPEPCLNKQLDIEFVIRLLLLLLKVLDGHI